MNKRVSVTAINYMQSVVKDVYQLMFQTMLKIRNQLVYESESASFNDQSHFGNV